MGREVEGWTDLLLHAGSCLPLSGHLGDGLPALPLLQLLLQPPSLRVEFLVSPAGCVLGPQPAVVAGASHRVSQHGQNLGQFLEHLS